MPFKSLISTYKSVNQYLGDFVDAVKDTPWPEAVVKALPWSAALGEGIADTVAPIKFVLSVYEAATRIDDPNQLGELACTAAFQRSVQQALTSVGVLENEKSRKKAAAQGADEVQEHAEQQEFDFTTMKLDQAIQHPFFLDAKKWLIRFMGRCVFEEEVRNAIVREVEQHFAENLELLLTNRDTLEKFDPFYRLLMLSGDSAAAYRALRKHAAYQRWLYEERRILREEPYALQHIYVRTDCGDLAWEDFDLRGKEKKAGKTERPAISPFVDHSDHGGRHDLLDAVFKHLSDPKFRELIVIQGPAGTGKSSFTLRLCHELLAKGLSPIRVELKHLDTAAQRHVRDTLPEAVRIGDEDFDPNLTEFQHKGLFLNNDIFKEAATVDGTEICRYVLILDAWDEISIGAEEGYQQHVERLLKEIRDTYLDGDKWRYKIRVILTGRPTEAVTQGGLMRSTTRLLTLRYFTVPQLAEFHCRLREAVTSQPLRLVHDGSKWTPPTAEALQEVRKQYEATLAQRSTSLLDRETRKEVGLELLGSPLLGLLSLRLLSQWNGQPDTLFNSRTLLYRSLIDLLLTGGKTKRESGDTSPHLHGDELRQLLWDTAEAMTVLGTEAIPRAELLERVKSTDSELDHQVGKLLGENKLSRLLVAFFFHGGRSEQGCEFSHKSFREYLFAECVVEELKRFGLDAEPLPERDVSKGYWRDFPADDPRREFCHRLVRLLGPQWLSREVGLHIAALIEWEVRRAAGNDPFPAVRDCTQTVQLPLAKWVELRRWLADAWDWWGEGVHLRPQPYKSTESPLNWNEPIALSVAKTDRLFSGTLAAIRPPRITTIDSHLGDALFQICCDVHRALIDYGGNAARGQLPRRYQSFDANQRVRFMPGGSGFWATYWHRIEAAGYRERFRGRFPEHINVSYIDWAGCDLSGLTLQFASLFGANLYGANLRLANLQRANLRRADIREARLNETDLEGADLQGAFLQGANLRGANLLGANLHRANLHHANLIRANLQGANLLGANLQRANLQRANLQKANCQGVKLEGTKLDGAIRD